MVTGLIQSQTQQPLLGANIYLADDIMEDPSNSTFLSEQMLYSPNNLSQYDHENLTGGFGR